MGMYLFGRCHTNVSKPLPIPNPSAFTILSKVELTKAHILRVRYLGCTNFEGEKILVYEGPYVKQAIRDPHFSHAKNSPVARFRPDAKGWEMAINAANYIESL